MINTEILKNTTITTDEFLNEIHGKEALIYFNVGNKTWTHKPQTYAEAKKNLKWLNQHKNQDICYIVNSGGTKNNQINNINASFLDWDSGKDADGNYFSLNIVKNKKTEFLAVLQSSPIIPSFVVETRNGFQVYWLLHSGATSEQFIDVQKRIAYYFKGDPSITNPCRVMRLPGYYWVKPKKNLTRFCVNIIKYNPVRYYINNLMSSFNSVTQDNYDSYRKSLMGNDRKGAHNNNSGYYKDNTSSVYVGTNPEDNEIIIDNRDYLIEYLKTMNPAKYFGLEPSDNDIILSCPFHEDKQPSAHLYKYEENGYYYLKCHSNRCNYGTATIIDIVMKQENCNTGKAIKILMEFFNIRLDDSWKDKKKKILEQNINIIKDIKKYKADYPNLYKGIGRITSDLISKLEFAKKHILFRSCNGEFLFVCALREFQKAICNPFYIEGDLGRQNERVDRYCLLGLMRKLTDEEIPDFLLANAYEKRDSMQRGLFKKNVNTPRTQFYTIPEYTTELLQEADNTMKLLKQSGVRMNAISRDLILELFGEEKAHLIYPQIKYKTLSKSGKAIKSKIEATLLIELNEKGYSKTSDIVCHLQKEYDWNSVTDRRVKKYIPGLLQKHNLVELTANKQLKEKYSIESKGYPKIIIEKNVTEVCVA
ncbi:MAG: hypothetical protein KAS96_10090 [Planctomycetes bacterium]|nr:hypothetical protein [Planctomycetota bacterium]